MNPATFNPSALRYSAHIWGEHISGNEDEAHHALAVRLPGSEMSVDLADIPLGIVAENMEQDGRGGSRAFETIALDADATASLVRYVATAADMHAELLAALKWCIRQMEGESGASASYWEEFLEYRRAVSLLAKAKGQP